jgi:hypothetical protein
VRIYSNDQAQRVAAWTELGQPPLPQVAHIPGEDGVEEVLAEGAVEVILGGMALDGGAGQGAQIESQGGGVGAPVEGMLGSAASVTVGDEGGELVGRRTTGEDQFEGRTG